MRHSLHDGPESGGTSGHSAIGEGRRVGCAISSAIDLARGRRPRGGEGSASCAAAASAAGCYPPSSREIAIPWCEEPLGRALLSALCGSGEPARSLLLDCNDLSPGSIVGPGAERNKAAASPGDGDG